MKLQTVKNSSFEAGVQSDYHWGLDLGDPGRKKKLEGLFSQQLICFETFSNHEGQFLKIKVKCGCLEYDCLSWKWNKN